MIKYVSFNSSRFYVYWDTSISNKKENQVLMIMDIDGNEHELTYEHAHKNPNCYKAIAKQFDCDKTETETIRKCIVRFKFDVVDEYRS